MEDGIKAGVKDLTTIAEKDALNIAEKDAASAISRTEWDRNTVSVTWSTTMLLRMYWMPLKAVAQQTSEKIGCNEMSMEIAFMPMMALIRGRPVSS